MRPTTSTRPVTATLLLAAGALLALALAGCGRSSGATPHERIPPVASDPTDPATAPATAPAPTPTSTGGLVVTTFTSDPPDAYTWTDPSGSTGKITITADPDNRRTNLRELAVAADAPSSRDQTSCATWWGSVVGETQPGVALRVRTTDSGSTQAITVSNNIWSSARTYWNVHVVEADGTGDGDEAMTRIGGSSLPGFGKVVYDMAPPPWRICGRVVGYRVDVKVWPPAREADEPAWDDADYVFSVDLPEGWDYDDGSPGLYAAHLAPGEGTTFTDWTTETE